MEEGPKHIMGDCVVCNTAEYSGIDCICFRPNWDGSVWVLSYTKRGR